MLGLVRKGTEHYNWGPERNCKPLPHGCCIFITLDPRSRTDPLVHHGRHFGRTVHALCSVATLLNNGILRIGELSELSEDTFTQEYIFTSI